MSARTRKRRGAADFDEPGRAPIDEKEAESLQWGARVKLKWNDPKDKEGYNKWYACMVSEHLPRPRRWYTVDFDEFEVLEPFDLVKFARLGRLDWCTAQPATDRLEALAEYVPVEPGQSAPAEEPEQAPPAKKQKSAAAALKSAAASSAKSSAFSVSRPVVTPPPKPVVCELVISRDEGGVVVTTLSLPPAMDLGAVRKQLEAGEGEQEGQWQLPPGWQFVVSVQEKPSAEGQDKPSAVVGPLDKKLERRWCVKDVTDGLSCTLRIRRPYNPDDKVQAEPGVEEGAATSMANGARVWVKWDNPKDGTHNEWFGATVNDERERPRRYYKMDFDDFRLQDAFDLGRYAGKSRLKHNSTPRPSRPEVTPEDEEEQLASTHAPCVLGARISDTVAIENWREQVTVEFRQLSEQVRMKRIEAAARVAAADAERRSTICRDEVGGLPEGAPVLLRWNDPGKDGHDVWYSATVGVEKQYKVQRGWFLMHFEGFEVIEPFNLCSYAASGRLKHKIGEIGEFVSHLKAQDDSAAADEQELGRVLQTLPETIGTDEEPRKKAIVHWYNWQLQRMELPYRNLEVRNTRNAGNGLFIKCAMQMDGWIEYGGTIYKNKQGAFQGGADNDYLWAVGQKSDNGAHVDGNPYVHFNPAGFINEKVVEGVVIETGNMKVEAVQKQTYYRNVAEHSKAFKLMSPGYKYEHDQIKVYQFRPGRTYQADEELHVFYGGDFDRPYGRRRKKAGT